MRFQVDTATSGRQILQMATTSPDYELILIDAGINDPVIAPLVQRLRRDYRTAEQRIGVLAREGYAEVAERATRDDPMSLAFPRPHLQKDFQLEMNQLAALGSRDFVGFDERQQQAGRSLVCLIALAQTKGIYDLRRVQEDVLAGLYARGQTPRVIGVLANLGTPDSQQALVDLCSRFGQPLEVRQLAAKAFRVSVLRFGILLTIEAIDRQYGRYDSSRTQDMQSQQVLASVLDTIEEPTEGKRPTKILRSGKPAAEAKPAARQPAAKTPLGKKE
jgi:CheY-like chemotaxis protein